MYLVLIIKLLYLLLNDFFFLCLIFANLGGQQHQKMIFLKEIFFAPNLKYILLIFLKYHKNHKIERFKQV